MLIYLPTDLWLKKLFCYTTKQQTLSVCSLISSHWIWRELVLFHWQIIYTNVWFKTVWTVLFLSFSLFLLICYFPVMQQTPTHSFSLNFFFLPLFQSCKQTEAGKLKWGRQSNPSSISLSWLLIQVPDALGSSANFVHLCVFVCMMVRMLQLSTNKQRDFVWKQSWKQLEFGSVLLICLETLQTFVMWVTNSRRRRGGSDHLTANFHVKLVNKLDCCTMQQKNTSSRQCGKI